MAVKIATLHSDAPLGGAMPSMPGGRREITPILTPTEALAK